ncbi:hypothetical protein HFO15_19960 [Rhizobium laguerreae]|uniref:hypothetical protein n=1 Tax=Rhizobium laguerreae TaxID=1076926 RepID=UPI001C9164F1|nr:hypothetical protein [Rhizobium laguerreae]MBY3263903.1 hypothetical protein [Rhizobium laguerreae]
MTQYVLLKRDLYECPGHMGYTGIRDKAGTWDAEIVVATGYHLMNRYQPSFNGHYALPLDQAPEFTNTSFHDLNEAHLRSKLEELRAAAEAVCWFDWSSNDDDAVAAIDRLRTVIVRRAA